MSELIIRQDGRAVEGVDPRQLTTEELNEHFQRMSPLKAIRAKCMDCSVYKRTEVRKCTVIDCPLWPFRMRKNPWLKRKKQNGFGFSIAPE
jgi:hypothetical protein